MTADREHPRGQILSSRLPEFLPEISLRHGQALWLLTELGFRGSAAQVTFYEYIKSLRKLGIPFENRAVGINRGVSVNYSYYDLMELALALTVRVYYFVPDSVLVGIIRYRRSLHKHYRRAYSERCTGIGAPIALKAKGCPPICMRGVFLDLQLNFSGGKLVKFGPPRALSPHAAASVFAMGRIAARALLPISLSPLSERVVGLSLRAPLIRRRPRSAV
jgi:hypothetical protein